MVLPLTLHSALETQPGKIMFTPDSKIFIAGHRGLVGYALLFRLEAEGFGKVVMRRCEITGLVVGG
ncbi:MAG: hypothetical protein DRN05_05960 [Thermoplasmata archaeon]|nr:MAG: hypothetical protein DRN05_05960 [Thermoplasmata archaeon]